MSEFLAEAAVLIQAETKLFKEQLAAALAIVPKAIEIPIVAIGGTGAAAKTAFNEVAAIQRAVVAGGVLMGESAADTAAALTTEGVAAQKAAVAEQGLASRRLTASAAASAYAQVEKALVAARVAGVRVVDGLVVGETGLAEATAAAAAARNFLTAAELQGVKAEELLSITAVREALAMGEAAAATEAKAAADELAARAAAHHSVQLTNLARGSVTAGLAAIGLRGATLTANAAFIGGAAAAIGFGKALSSAAQFESSLNVFKVTAEATADQMERVRQVSRELGADLTLPGVNAQDAAESLSGLARAGLSVQNSIDGVRGVLQLATAAAIPNEEAVTLVASALNAFSLSGKEASRVADLLAASSKESQGSISDVGLALQQSAAAAAQAGVNVQDTIALLTELGRAGLRGSDAGTSLRVALIRLIAPTKQAKEALDGLGVAIRDQAGNVRPEVFAEITQALSGFTRAQRDATLALIFGQDAFRAASILGRDGAKGLNEMRDATQEAGVAAELAAARTQGLSGSFENLKNQASTLGLSIGTFLSTPTQDFLDIVAGGFGNLNAFTDWLSGLDQKTPRAKQSIADLADEFARLNKEAGGSGSLDKATQRVAELGRPAAIAVLDYADLTKELGKLSFAFDALKAQGASLETPGAKKLRADILELIQALNDTEPAGLKAAAGIEGFRSSITATAIALERIKRAIMQPEGFLPKAPVLPELAPIPKEAQLEGAAGIASARGNLAELLRIRKEQLDAARKAFRTTTETGDARVKLFNAMRSAEASVITVQQQIAAEQKQKQEAADRKREQDAADAKRRREKADQAVLDSFAPEQTRLNISEVNANVTKTLKDDLAVQVAVANQASREIAIIDKTVKDQKTREAAIRERVATLARSAANIDTLRKQITENALKAAKTARDVITDTLGKRLQIAQLRGGKDAILAAFDRAIRDARVRANKAKKLGLVQIDEQLALETLIHDRKEFLKGLEKDTKQSITAFDLLKQFTDTFNQTAGNLINQNQPFAGPSGFTADIAQFLIKRPGGPTAPQKTQVELSDDLLVRALNRLSDVVERASGNTTTGGGSTLVAPTQGSPWAGRPWFVAAKQSRDFQEG